MCTNCDRGAASEFRTREKKRLRTLKRARRRLNQKFPKGTDKTKVAKRVKRAKETIAERNHS